MKRALLVIDVQNEYFTGKLRVTYPTVSFENILKVVDAANQEEIPVILVRHESPQKDATTFVKGSRGWEIHQDILKRKYTHIINKNLPGSFTGTKLENLLQTMGIDAIVICGYMTQMCCDTTARQAVHLGFAVEFLSDATGTLNIENDAGKITAEELHKSVLITQAMTFSKIITTSEWIESL